MSDIKLYSAKAAAERREADKLKGLEVHSIASSVGVATRKQRRRAGQDRNTRSAPKRADLGLESPLETRSSKRPESPEKQSLDVAGALGAQRPPSDEAGQSGPQESGASRRTRGPNAGLLRLPQSVVLPERRPAAMEERDAKGVVPKRSAADPEPCLEGEPLSKVNKLMDEFGKLEKTAAKNIKNIRADCGKLRDICLLGTAVGARDLNDALMKLNQCCEAVKETIATVEPELHELILVCNSRDFRCCLSSVKRLLSMRRSALDIFLSMLDQRGATENTAQISAKFCEEIEELAAWVGVQLHFFSIVYDKSSEVDGEAARSEVLELCQVLFATLGSLSRYKEVYGRSTGASVDTSFAEAYYLHSSMIYTPNGSIYKNLATLAKWRGNVEDTVRLLLLGMSMTNQPFGGRDVVLGYLEKQRNYARSLPEVHALSNCSAGDHLQRYSAHLYGCVCVAYSRSGADTFLFHLERMRRHFSASLQLNAVGGATTDEKNESLEHACTSGFTIVISVLHLISRKFELNSVLGEDIFSTSNLRPTADNDQCSVINSRDLESAVLRRLNAIRATPGFVDAANLMCSFILCLLGGTGLGLYSSVLNDEDAVKEMSRFRVTLQTVSIFLDWMMSDTMAHVIQLLEPATWQQVEAALQSYFVVLQSSMSKKQLRLNELAPYYDIILPEDLLLRGFNPLHHCIEGRFSLPLNSFWTTKDFIFTVPSSFASASQLLTLNVVAAADTQLGGAASGKHSLDIILLRYIRCRRNMKMLSKVPLKWPWTCCSSVTKNEETFIYWPPLYGHREGGLEIAFDNSAKPFLDNADDRDSELSRPRKMLLNCSVTMLSCSAASVATRSIKVAAPKGLLLPGFGNPSNENAPSIAGGVFDDKLEESDEDECLLKSLANTISLEDHESDVSCETRLERDARIGTAKVTKTELEGSTLPNGVLKVDVKIVEASRKLPSAQPADKADEPSASRASLKKTRSLEKRLKSTELFAQIFPNQSVGLDKRPGGVGGTKDPPLIVLDIPNIAMRHGQNVKFSCRGVRLVFDFFLHMGHKVVGFLPDYYLDMERIGELRRAANSGVKVTRAARLPDDVHILQQLAAQGYLVCTPPQDYDDSYCISYARTHDGYLVTNDLYRDHISKIENSSHKYALKNWLQSHCLSYTFVHDEFLPNPDAKF